MKRPISPYLAWAALALAAGSAFPVNAWRLIHLHFPLFLLWLFVLAAIAVGVAIASSASEGVAPRSSGGDAPADPSLPAQKERD